MPPRLARLVPTTPTPSRTALRRPTDTLRRSNHPARRRRRTGRLRAGRAHRDHLRHAEQSRDGDEPHSRAIEVRILRGGRPPLRPGPVRLPRGGAARRRPGRPLPGGPLFVVRARTLRREARWVQPDTARTEISW